MNEFKQAYKLENNRTDQEVKSAKQILWEKQLERIDKIVDEFKIVDDIGEPVDPGIKETVAAFQLNGLPTCCSCEGHLDHGILSPFIDIEALGEPEERFIGQKELLEKIAKQYNTSVKDTKTGKNKVANDAYWDEIQNIAPDETTEYKAWREKNESIGERARSFLDEFYLKREVSPEVKLTLTSFGFMFRVHNGDHDIELDSSDITESQKEEFSNKLERRKQEMKVFTEFLKQKFFYEGE